VRAALEGDGELAPVCRDGEEDADAMQKRSASLNTWSALTNTSCGEAGERLEELGRT
jgi:hypothetical protein